MTSRRFLDASCGCHDEMAIQVETSIYRLQSDGRRVSFYSVAEQAGIARSTLYRRDDLREMVMVARTRSNGRTRKLRPPFSQRQMADLQAELRKVTLERDFLLQDCQRMKEAGRRRACRYTLVSFDTCI